MSASTPHSDLLAEGKRIASWAPAKPESVHEVLCCAFNQLDAQHAALQAAISLIQDERDNLVEQLEAAESEVQQWRDSIATEKLRWRAEEAEEKLAALADCVMKGWTEPAFARGHLQERAVAIAREALNPASEPTGPKTRVGGQSSRSLDGND